MVTKDKLKNHLPYWKDLNNEDKELLINESITSHFKKGTLIHRGDGQCTGSITLESGQFRIYIVSEEGREVTLFRINSGESCVLSASCLLDSIAFNVLIEAIEDTDAIIIPSNILNRVISHNKDVELYLYKTATERFSEVMWTMQQILFFNIDKRIAYFLLEESKNKNAMTLTLTHEEIARYIGSAREVITRILKYFASENVVTLSRGKIEIINENKLKSYVI